MTSRLPFNVVAGAFLLTFSFQAGEVGTPLRRPAGSPAPTSKLRTPPSPCNEMHRVACDSVQSRIALDDGTGTASLTRNQEVHDEVFNSSMAGIRAKLNESTIFRRMSLESTRSRLSRECRSSGLPMSSICFEEVARNTFEMLWNWGIENERPTSNSSVQWVFQWMLSPESRSLKSQVIRSYQAKANTYVADGKARQMLESIRTLMIQRVQRMPISSADRAALVARLRAVKYDSSGCRGRDARGYRGMVSENASFNHRTNTIQVCPGLFLNETSAYALGFTIAHELAHSIDPGSNVELAFFYRRQTRRQFEAENPFAAVVSCLRSPRGANARILSTGSDSNQRYRASSAPIADSVYRSEAKHADQITEAFADWMALEVVPEYIHRRFPRQSNSDHRRGYVNLYKSMCNGTDDGTHNDNFDRFSIGMANPTIRRAMGCKGPGPRRYCDAQSAQPAARSTGARPARSNR